MEKSTRLWADWRPIDTAPWDEDVTLLVTDGRGEPYQIPYPCKRTRIRTCPERRGWSAFVSPDQPLLGKR